MNWWKRGIELTFRVRPLGLAIAAMYAITCWAAWRVSLDQFYLPAGIRVAALLVCPPRLWSYLLIGEYAFFAQLRYPLIDDYGLAWVILGSAFLLPAVALVVHAHRKFMTAKADAWLLSVAVSAAVIATALKLGLSHLLSENPSSVPIATRAVRFVLGDYIAILTVAPLAVLWSRRHAMYEWRLWRSPPTIAALAVMLGLGLVTALAPGLSDASKTSLQLTMALPVIVLTCIHGWQGAAIGVPLLNILIAVVTPTSGLLGSYDDRTFTTQQLIAIAGTGLLALGSRITRHYHQRGRSDADGHQTARLSRSAHMASEMDLRERALDLRRIADGIEVSLNKTVDLLKTHGHHSCGAGSSSHVHRAFPPVPRIDQHGISDRSRARRALPGPAGQRHSRKLGSDTQGHISHPDRGSLQIEHCIAAGGLPHAHRGRFIAAQTGTRTDPDTCSLWTTERATRNSAQNCSTGP